MSLKKIIPILLVLTLALGLGGCKSKKDVDNSSSEVLQSGTLTAPDGEDTSVEENSSKKEEGKTSQSQEVSSKTEPAAGGAAKITYIFLDNVPLKEFTRSKTEYTVQLADDVKSAPTVSALKSGGTGEIKIVQAKNTNSSATVSLNGVTYTIKFTKKDYSGDLKNSYYKLSVKKKLNVAYFGGSVTQGFGVNNPNADSWRAITTKWLKARFPSAAVNEINAAIGGTGSSYAVYRAVEDLKLKTGEKPDLVFLEFAINDVYDGITSDTAKSNIEYIIRTIYSYSPDCDIILVFTTDQGQMNKDYDMMQAHISVADAYKLPYIKVGAMLWDDMTAENGGKYPSAQWGQYFTDAVHPAAKGYKKYAEYITDYLNNAFSAKKTIPTSTTNAYQPQKAINSQPSYPYMASFKGQGAPTGFTVDANGYLKGSGDGKSFTFTFTGTGLKLWCWSTATAGNLKTEIDGKPYGTAELYRSSANHKIVELAEGLENKQHTVKLTLNKSSYGSDLELRYVLIGGSSNQAGVMLQ